MITIQKAFMLEKERKRLRERKKREKNIINYRKEFFKLQ